MQNNDVSFVPVECYDVSVDALPVECYDVSVDEVRLYRSASRCYDVSVDEVRLYRSASRCVPPSMRNDEYYALLISVVSVECCDVSANDVSLC